MKKTLRIAVSVVFALVLILGMTSSAFAAPSIQDDPKKPHIDDPSGGDTGGGGTTTDNKYKGSPSDIAKKMKYNPEKMKTTDGLTVNLRLYDRITDVVDLGEKKNGVTSYKLNETKKVTVKTDVLKGLKKSDVLAMVIDPDTGEIYLISAETFDSENGIMTFETPSYGKFCLIQKVPIVVRDIHPEEYPNLEVGKSVSKVDEGDYQELSEWLKVFDIDDDELEVAKNYTVDVDDYSSADYVADIAVRLSKDTFNYKLNTRVWANLYQDINEVNWARVLDYAGVDYDIEKIKKDPLELTKIEPFVLEDCFIYHVDAETGDVSIAYEPEIKFEVEEEQDLSLNKKVKNGQQDLEENDVDLQMNDLDDVDNVNEVEDNVYKKEKKELEDPDANDSSMIEIFIEPAYAKAQDHYTQEQKDILTFDVEDIDEKNIENLCIVMTSDKYLGMGPFLLFMPKEKTSLWWLWIILIILVLVAIYVYYRYRKEKNKQAEE